MDWLWLSIWPLQFEWFNIKGIQNLDRFILHLPQHVPRFAINKDCVLLDPFRVWWLFTQPNEHTPGVLPQVLPMHDTCYFWNLDSQLSYIYTAYTSLACVAFATILQFHTLATCQATTWLVETRPAAGHPLSVLLQAFHQSNFAILAICPHALAGCVLWSGPETHLCFRVHFPPLAGSSTTVNSSLILQNAPLCYVR